MASVKKPHVDAVIVGFGWTGAILAKELTEAGLKVVALERGEYRDTYPDGAYPNTIDELTYSIRKKLYQDLSKHGHGPARLDGHRPSVPATRRLSAGRGRWRRRIALVGRALSHHRARTAPAQSLHRALRRQLHSAGNDRAGLWHYVR